MATLQPRESTFMPTIKCSQCDKEVEISMMGDHLCSGASGAAPPAPVAAPAAGGAFASLKQTFFGFGSRATPAPPSVDTNAANNAFQDQLTPVSTSTESRTISPKTPTGRSGSHNSGDFVSPAIVESSSSPRGGRPGGYGGLAETEPMDGGYSPSPPKKQAPSTNSLLQKMNTIAPGPFEIKRRAASKNAFAPNHSEDAGDGRLSSADAPRNEFGADRGSTGSSSSTNGGVAPPRLPRKNGYGGFGPPRRESELAPEPEAEPEPEPVPAPAPLALASPDPAMSFASPQRSPLDDFPTPPMGRLATPSRDSANQRTEPKTRSREHKKQPSYAIRDTSRPPPPRRSLVPPPRTGRDGSLSVNLAEEFGAGNPYHSPTISQSSSNSTFSHMSQQSRTSTNATSPARSKGPGYPSNGSNFDGQVDDLRSPTNGMEPYDEFASRQSRGSSGRAPSNGMNQDGRLDDMRSPVGVLSPNQSSMRTSNPAPPQSRPTDRERSSRDASNRSGVRPPRPDGMRGDPAVQGGRGNDPALQSGRGSDSALQGGRESDPALQGRRAPRPRSPLASPALDASFSNRMDPAVQASDRGRPPVNRDQKKRSQSVGRSRGNCKACKLPITGKSISSADGRLTGRYHKACFVCMTCQEPFSSATFYVLDDQPYCERHYHRLNGSLCGSCGRGIEGQYLEDEKNTKYHAGCFSCADCDQPLKDGYFEVSGLQGKAFCERDAWRRSQQPVVSGRGGTRPPPNGRPYGLPTGGRLAPPGGRPRMEKRMTRLGMI